MFIDSPYEGLARRAKRAAHKVAFSDFSKRPFDNNNYDPYYLDEAANNMSITDLKQFIDLGGVFVLAMVLLNQWGTRFGAIEDKLTRLIALLCLALAEKVPVGKIEQILTEKELKVVQQTQ